MQKYCTKVVHRWLLVDAVGSGCGRRIPPLEYTLVVPVFPFGGLGMLFSSFPSWRLGVLGRERRRVVNPQAPCVGIIGRYPDVIEKRIRFCVLHHGVHAGL